MESLDAFVKQLTQSLIPGEEPVSSSFFRDFIECITTGYQVHTEALAEIDGILIFSDPIQIEVGNTQLELRAISKTDMEREFRIQIDEEDYRFPPSAIVEMRTKGREEEVRRVIRQILILLNLFAVGSICCRCIRLTGYQSPGGFWRGLREGYRGHHPKYKYSVTPELGERLRLFCTKLSDYLPTHLFDVASKTKDHLSTACERYTEALTSSVGFERTVADGVMVLESLFLKGGSELQFRLSRSVAKILGLLGHDPAEAATFLQQAYGIRSKFVHGGFLTPSQQKDIDRDYGNQQGFLSNFRGTKSPLQPPPVAGSGVNRLFDIPLLFVTARGPFEAEGFIF